MTKINSVDFNSIEAHKTINPFTQKKEYVKLRGLEIKDKKEDKEIKK